jgi:hypothetical protein
MPAGFVSFGSGRPLQDVLGSAVAMHQVGQSVVTIREALALILIKQKTSFVASTVMGRLLPSLRSRLEVQSDVVAALDGKTNCRHWMTLDRPTEFADLFEDLEQSQSILKIRTTGFASSH